MHGLIGRPVVSLLEKDVCPDVCSFETFVVLDSRSGTIDIHPSYTASIQLCVVDRLYHFFNVINGTIHRILAALQCKSLVTHGF